MFNQTKIKSGAKGSTITNVLDSMQIPRTHFLMTGDLLPLAA